MLATTVCACGARTELRASSDGAVIDTCHLDAGRFACGDAAACDSLTEYCHEVAGGPPPGVDILECRPLPETCNVRCFDAQSGCFCKDDGGAILVTCPVP